MKNKKLRTFAVWMLLIGLLTGAYVLKGSAAPELPTLDNAQLTQDLRAMQVAELEVADDGVSVYLVDGSAYRVHNPSSHDWMMVSTQNLPVTTHQDESSALATVLTVLIPVVFLVLILMWFVRRQKSGPTGVLELRKSRARLLEPQTQTTFKHVGGAEEAKARLGDVVDYLRHPEHWQTAGVRLPRGVLFEGPPGCGKTLLARAVAGEAGVPVFVVSASEFVEMFVGVGAARVRDMFEESRKAAPAVIFIDEIDAIGGRRGAGISTAHDEREQTLNQLLVCLDGIEKAQGKEGHVVVIAATNRSDILDRALLRPGRFDVRLSIPPPDLDARIEILRIHTENKKLNINVDLAALARRTEGLNGADLENLCNSAAMTAVRRKLDAKDDQPAIVGMDDFTAKLDRRDEEAVLFDQLDALLVDSAAKLSKAEGTVHVRVQLADDQQISGELLWADAAWLKIRTDSGKGRLIPKMQVRWVEAGEGTAAANADDVMRAGRPITPGVA